MNFVHTVVVTQDVIAWRLTNHFEYASNLPESVANVVGVFSDANCNDHCTTLCRYPLMREKCFGGVVAALSRHSHLFPERPIVVLAFSQLAQLVLRSYRSASVAPRLRTPPPHPKTFPVLVSANYLPVLPVLTPFSLSRGDTLSPTGSHPVIQHVFVWGS